MKNRLLLFIVFACFLGTVKGQILETVYSETFQNGLYYSNMVRVDYDNKQYHQDILNLDEAFNYGGKGWYDWFEGNNILAVSPSKYVDGGVSDDWLITPAIELPDADNLTFIWKSASYKAEEPNGYRIMVSTTGQTKDDFTDEPIAVVESEEGELVTHMASLDNYRGQTVYIAIHSNTDGFMLMIDDLSVVVLKQMSDIMTVEPTTIKMSSKNTVKLTGRLRTEYGSAITNATVNWVIDGENYTQEIKSFNYNEAGNYYDFSIDKNVDIPSSGLLKYSMEVISGEMNAFCEDEVYYINSFPYNRVVVIEERTGTWCPWCIRGAAALEVCREMYPENFIGIAVHNTDVMADASYDGAIAAYASAGFPASVGNRLSPFDPYPERCINFVRETMNKNALAAMDVNSQINGNKVSVDVNAVFSFDADMAALNVAIVVLEHNICRPDDPEYSQKNAYSGGSEGIMYGYESKPSTITDFVFQDVARGIFPGIGGAKAFTQFRKGTPVTYSCEIDLPGSVLDVENMEVVALLIDPQTGEILNAGSDTRDFGFSDVREVIDVNGNVVVYNSGADVMADLSGIDGEVSVSIYNLNGVKCLDRKLAGGSLTAVHTLRVPGIYIVKVTGEGVNGTCKIVY